MKQEHAKEIACQFLGKDSVELLEGIHGEYCDAFELVSRRAVENMFPLDHFSNFLQSHPDHNARTNVFNDLLRLEEHGIFLEVAVHASWVIGDPVNHSEWWEESVNDVT